MQKVSLKSIFLIKWKEYQHGTKFMANISKKLKKILVAIDFSESSDFALSRAVELAKANNAEITILHVIEKKHLDELLDNYLSKILPESLWLTTEEYYLNLLQEKINSLSTQNLKIKKVIISKGKPPVKVLYYAKKNKFDLLVIGAHGKYSIRDSFVGTTAEYIAAKTKCPVLIIKNKPVKSYSKILVPIDFSAPSKNALNSALQLFSNASIELLHIGDHEYENLLKQEIKKENIPKNKLIKLRKAVFFYLEDKMKKFIKSVGKKHQKLSCSIDLGYPGPIILKESAKKNRDLIAMGTQGHGKMHYLFMGRVAHAVLRETEKDILLVPPKKYELKTNI